MSSRKGESRSNTFLNVKFSIFTYISKTIDSILAKS